VNKNIVNNFRREVNRLSSIKEPFIIIVDFDLNEPLVYQLGDLPKDIQFCTPLISNFADSALDISKTRVKSTPVDFGTYSEAFNKVLRNIKHGNSYLLNLTFPSGIETNLSLEEIFATAVAKYKLLFKDKFVVFSPETFISIDNGRIKSFPMKGTIDASVEGALDKILNDEKELSEHNTIVDLIRNDLSMVATNVEVSRYRYHEYIKAGNAELIQISSEIEGDLGAGWEDSLGDIIVSLLPAGSISGAPKKETVRIIKESEMDSRGYYTGVFGVFDGERFDSAVMIRYIEQIGGKYVYRSGGGITYLSDLRKEYEELIAKVYVPSG
jgi:para-aminobenzoate synthetase component 1